MLSVQEFEWLFPTICYKVTATKQYGLAKVAPILSQMMIHKSQKTNYVSINAECDILWPNQTLRYRLHNASTVHVSLNLNEPTLWREHAVVDTGQLGVTW